jgi:hypothetical protein
MRCRFSNRRADRTTTRFFLQFGSQDVRDYCVREGMLEVFERAGVELIEPGAVRASTPGLAFLSEPIRSRSVLSIATSPDVPVPVRCGSPALLPSRQVLSRAGSSVSRNCEQRRRATEWGVCSSGRIVLFPQAAGIYRPLLQTPDKLRVRYLSNLTDTRLDFRLKVAVQDPLGFEHEFEMEQVWLLAIIDVCPRAVLSDQIVLAREYCRYGVIRTIENWAYDAELDQGCVWRSA